MGIWHIDQAGAVTQLFPNDNDQDHFLAVGRPQTIPGDKPYKIQVSAADGKEYLYAAASTHAWNSRAGTKLGPHVVFATPEEIKRWQDDVRGMSLVAGDGARVAEVVLEMTVAGED